MEPSEVVCKCALFQTILQVPDYECALCSTQRHAAMHQAYLKKDRKRAVVGWCFMGSVLLLIALLAYR